jgi:tripartite-type tricarboxylate transporter receptor subunit TctC
MKAFRSILIALLMAPLAALGQGYPNKPVRVVVPYSAGGVMDTLARTMSKRLSEALGQPVVIDTRAGAGGMIGADMVAKAAPDGYTLVFTAGPPHAMYSFLLKNVPFDTVNDFSPIVMIGTSPRSVVVHPSLPVTSVKELIDYAKKNPSKLSYGTPGVGTGPHIAGLMLNRAAGIDMVHIPYKGGASALNDVIGGQIPVAMLSLSTVMPYVRSGKLRLLGVLDAQRAKALPDMPTIAEAGVHDYAIPDTWVGLLGPANMPPAIVGQINAAVLKAITFPDVRSRLDEAGFEVKGTTPQRFADHVMKSFETYGMIMTEAGIKPE